VGVDFPGGWAFAWFITPGSSVINSNETFLVFPKKILE